MRFLLLCTLLLIVGSAYAQSIVYVTESGRGNESGTSWTNALPGTALAGRVATAPAGTQFWIAAGTYKPTTTTDRTASFNIRSGVMLHGGFSGYEARLDQRVTFGGSILSGNIGNPSDYLDNSLHVVRITDVSGTVVFDRMVVADGRSTSSSGAGLSIESTNCQTRVQLIDSRFVSNKITRSLTGGGALFVNAYANANCQLLVSDCFFMENEAGFGGAVCLYTTGGTLSARFIQSQFRQNIGQEGGAISGKYLDAKAGDTLQIDRCHFLNNQADYYGGALATGRASSLVYASDFNSNSVTSPWGGGGAVDLSDASSLFSNCLFINNKAAYGGAVAGDNRQEKSEASFQNCTFTKNHATIAGEVADIQGTPLQPDQTNILRFSSCLLWANATAHSSFNLRYQGIVIDPRDFIVDVRYSLVEDGYVGTGNISADPLFVNAAADDYRLSANSPAVDAGDPTRFDLLTTKDRGNRPRIQGGHLDMGAYEFECDLSACSPFIVRRNR